MILDVVSALGKTSYGIHFGVETKDFYVSDDGMSCGAKVEYKHSWTEGAFKLDISLRETPSLTVEPLALKPQPYFKYLEFKPFPIPSFRFEEMLGEKIRAASQRLRSRDVYDLAKAAERPTNPRLIRALAVIKCWNVGKPFEPERLLGRLHAEKYDWDDLRALVRRSERVDPEKMLAACEKRYKFLLDLTDGERRLIDDAKRRKLTDLPNALLKEAGR